jgi:hypothetical protein
MAGETPTGHPLGEQCSATSKRSGKRCQRRVIGGGPCIMHGGKARQVKARREQRVLLYEAQAKAAPPVVEPEPEPTADETLIAVLADVRRILRQLRAELDSNPSPQLFILLGDWLDRCDRISRSVIVTNAEARVEQRKAAVTQVQADTLATAMHLGVTASDLSARQRVEVVEAVLGAVQRASAGELPLIDAETMRNWLVRMRREAAAESMFELEAGPLDEDDESDLVGAV